MSSSHCEARHITLLALFLRLQSPAGSPRKINVFHLSAPCHCLVSSCLYLHHPVLPFSPPFLFSPYLYLRPPKPNRLPPFSSLNNILHLQSHKNTLIFRHRQTRPFHACCISKPASLACAAASRHFARPEYVFSARDRHLTAHPVFSLSRSQRLSWAPG